MKLATLKDGSRDGQLVVVSRDLHSAVIADAVVPTLQRALDDWPFYGAQLDALYAALNQGRARRAFEFDPRDCLAPLPRSYNLLAADVYPDHARLLTDALHAPAIADAALPRGLPGDPLYGPTDDVVCQRSDEQLDCVAQLAVVSDGVPRGALASRALASVRLLGLACSYVLRAPAAGTEAGVPLASAFSPVLISPDEAGTAWRDGRLHRALSLSVNGRLLAEPDCAAGMAAGFGALLASAAARRPLSPGAICLAGPVASLGRSHALGSVAGKRAVETITSGAASTPYLAPGDRVTLAFADSAEDASAIASLHCGQIEQRITDADGARGA